MRSGALIWSDSLTKNSPAEIKFLPNAQTNKDLSFDKLLHQIIIYHSLFCILGLSMIFSMTLFLINPTSTPLLRKWNLKSQTEQLLRQINKSWNLRTNLRPTNWHRESFYNLLNNSVPHQSLHTTTWQIKFKITDRTVNSILVRLLWWMAEPFNNLVWCIWIIFVQCFSASQA